MRRLIAAPLAAAALLLGACTTSTPGEDAARERLVESIEATRAAGSSAMSLVVSEAVDTIGSRSSGGTEEERFTGEGLLDYESGDAVITFDLGAGAGTAEIRAIGDQYFVQVPGRDEWLALDADVVAQQLGDPSGFQSVVGTDPTGVLDLLAGAEQVRQVGRNTIRGAETRHYTALIDAAAAADRAEGTTKRALRDLAASLDGGTLPVQVWLDAEDRVRRLKIPVLQEGDAEQPRRITTTIEFFDFGTEVDVRPPTAG